MVVVAEEEDVHFDFGLRQIQSHFILAKRDFSAQLFSSPNTFNYHRVSHQNNCIDKKEDEILVR